jgi:hypothetical protein
MAKSRKEFALRPDQIRPLADGRGGCIASDMITVEGRKVWYMYRDEPLNDRDSGWCFTAGRESRTYMDDPANCGVYDVNTIANYDPDIIPFLDAPAGSAFERQGPSRRFVQVEGEPWEPGTKPAKKWPPPGFPIVEGHQPLAAWAIHLPERFARRVEGGRLVLWRPGLTVWMMAWNNDRGQSQAERLAWIKGIAPPGRWAERESSADGITRFSFRLHDRNDDGPVESLSAFIIGDDGLLQMSVYFDDPADEATAQHLVGGVAPSG